MRLFYMYERNFYGGNGIVGAQIPVSVFLGYRLIFCAAFIGRRRRGAGDEVSRSEERLLYAVRRRRRQSGPIL